MKWMALLSTLLLTACFNDPDNIAYQEVLVPPLHHHINDWSDNPTLDVTTPTIKPT